MFCRLGNQAGLCPIMPFRSHVWLNGSNLIRAEAHCLPGPQQHSADVAVWLLGFNTHTRPSHLQVSAADAHWPGWVPRHHPDSHAGRQPQHNQLEQVAPDRPNGAAGGAGRWAEAGLDGKRWLSGWGSLADDGFPACAWFIVQPEPKSKTIPLIHHAA